MRVLHWHVELAAVCILDCEYLAARAVHLHLGGAEEPAHAVLEMHHQLARSEVEGLGEARADMRAGSGPRAPSGGRAVALRDHHQPRHLEAACELFVVRHNRAAPLRGEQMRGQLRPHGLGERGVHGPSRRAQLREAGKRRHREVNRGHAPRRGVAGEDAPRGPRRGRRAERIRVVLQPQHDASLRHNIQKRTRLPRLYLHWRELGRLDARHRHLRGGVELAERLQVVAEELRPHGALRRRRPGVHHTAAHGILPLLRHLRRALVSCFGKAAQHLRERRRSTAHRQAQRGVRHRRGGRHSLRKRGDRRHHHKRIRPHRIRADGCRHLEPRSRRRSIVL